MMLNDEKQKSLVRYRPVYKKYDAICALLDLLQRRRNHSVYFSSRPLENFNPQEAQFSNLESPGLYPIILHSNTKFYIGSY